MKIGKQQNVNDGDHQKTRKEGNKRTVQNEIGLRLYIYYYFRFLIQVFQLPVCTSAPSIFRFNSALCCL